ncbi:MAG TPA: histidinol-phosphatase HisJ [Desulfitobacteriaceae bacterium]|nr:histidinol-phosphatase HisJ [Desulfitobacteriaceae bacterium]
MSLANYHTHSCFCDGEGDPESYVIESIERGLDAIGFSSHAPIPFFKSYVMEESRLPAYCETIKKLKVKYQDKIQIYLGLEIDYIPDAIGPGSPRFKGLGLDYTIGSIHFIKNPHKDEFWELDESPAALEKLIREIFKDNIHNLISYYFLLIRQMIREHKPDIIGHLDLIKKFNNNNQFFNEDDELYIQEIQETLRVIAAAGSVLEINTGGISRGYIKTLYPSAWIIKESKRLGIPVILNSDAHSPKSVAAFFDQALEILQEAGYLRQRRLVNGSWKDTVLEK